MRVRVDSALTLQASELSPKLRERLFQAMSFPNPEFVRRLRMGKRVGDIPEQLHFIRWKDGQIRIPRGAIHVLKRLAAAERQTVQCEDHRCLPVERLPELPIPLLRDYQRDAVDAMVAATQGTAIMACGSGKTRCGIAAIARLRLPSIILVHTLDLAEQWRTEIQKVLGLEAAVIGGNEHGRGPITIALVQSLANWDEERLDDLLSQFGLLIVDEAHHVSGLFFRTIVDRCPAKYRFGLTATPEREDGLTPVLDLFLGPPVATVNQQQLVEAGVLTLPEVRTVETGFQFPYECPEDYQPMLDALIADDKRNGLIADTVAREASAGNLCMVLTGRIDHCQALRDLIRARGVRAELLTGEIKKDRRAELLQAARAGELQVLVATTLADEGLDLVTLSRVFLTYPGKARGRTIQRIGRVMRTAPGKEDAIVFDFIDTKVPVLRRHHIQRKQLYAEVLGLPASAIRAAGFGRSYPSEVTA